MYRVSAMKRPDFIVQCVYNPVKKTENTAIVIRHADQVVPSIRKSWQTSPTGGSRSVGIVLSRTQATECF
jgi:hypothetical protein